MQELLFHPAVQAAVIPFVVAAILTIGLNKIRVDISAIVLLAGFLTTCYLITDMSLQPLTSTKKLIVLTIIAAVWGLLLQYRPLKNSHLLLSIAIVSLMACSWLLWPVLSRKEFIDAALLALPLTFYSIAIVSLATFVRSTSSSKLSNIEFHLISLIFAAISAVSCVIAASALYGQMTAALAASSAAYILITILSKGSLRRALDDGLKRNSLFAVLLYFPISLITVSATIYASLPWYVLPCLAAIPAILFVKISNSYSAWQRLGIRVVISTLPSAMALYFTWDAAGPLSF